MFNFVSSFLSFVKMVIVGDNEATELTGKKIASYLVYGLFVIFMLVSYNSTKNLHHLSKRYKKLLEESKGLSIEAAKVRQCEDTLEVKKESLKLAVSALQHRCPSIVYVDKQCDVSVYGNFLDDKQ